LGCRSLKHGLAAARDRRFRENLKQGYRKLLTATRKVVNQAKRFREEMAKGVKRTKDQQQKLVLQALRKDLETMLPRVQQVIRQSRARVLGGDVHAAGKLVSVFEPSTEVIRKGKASKPTEFGKMVKIQEAENQIITHYEVFEKRPNDADLLVPAVQKHERQFGRVPQLVAGDAGFYSAGNEAVLQEMGVRQISVPNRSTKTRTTTTSEEALLPQRPEVANRSRRSHQCAQTTPWTEPLSLSRRRWHATVGGLGRDR
jgi:transposase, IS5 family